jgi:hypothetical protein
LQKLATTFLARERLELAAGDRLLTRHFDISLFRLGPNVN